MTVIAMAITIPVQLVQIVESPIIVMGSPLEAKFGLTFKAYFLHRYPKKPAEIFLL